MNEFHYFPTAIYREEKPEWVNHVLKNVQKYYDQQRQINEEQNNFWPLIQTVHLGNDPELFFLSDYFKNAATELLRKQGYFLDPFEFFTSGMWAQEIGLGGFHEPHVHANTQICGLFFLQTPERGSYPVFSDPRISKSMTDLMMADNEVRVGTPKIYFDSVIPGTFMFFNAWLPHQLSICQSQEPTKFIHFTLSFK